MADVIPEILLVDKPKGMTSFDVIRALRKKFGIEKMGHAGTLDPMATGLMIVGVGTGTKRMEEFLKLPKVYEAEIKLGVRTDTGDITGAVVEVKSISQISEEKVCTALAGMVGELSLPVPAYSAIKKQGKPLYKYAREGETVELPIKPMSVSAVSSSSYIDGVLTATFSVGSGTYIRSLAEEIGRRLGTVATLQNLRRISIGSFDVKNAMTL